MTAALRAPALTIGEVDATINAIASVGLPVASVIREPLSDDAWREVLGRVAAQRLDGLLVRAVAAGTLRTSETQRRSSLALHRRTMMRSLSLEHLLLGIVDGFGEQGITYRVLKGPAIAHTIYADPSLRSFCDVDVLVPGDSFDAAAAMMVSRGAERRYDEPRPGFDRRFSKGASFVTPDGLSIDLHRTFVLGPFGHTIDVDGLFACAREFSLAGRTLMTLPLEETFVHVCLHTALGDWPPRLVPMRDVAEIASKPDLDVARVHQLAQSWRATAPMAWSIEHVWDTFDLPAHALADWARAYVPKRRERHAMALYMSTDRSYASMALASTRVVSGLAAKVAYLRALALPKRSYVADRERNYLNRWRHASQVALRRPRGRDQTNGTAP